MELKLFIGPAISFVLALIAFIPLVKYRLKATEKITEQQRLTILKIEEKSHEMELKMLASENDASSKAMAKMADAMLLVAESNSKFLSIIDVQSELIKQCHTRIDEHIKENGREIGNIKEKYVSHPFLTEALKSKG